MKERELEELFRDAADTAPPATFDEQDVARGARRVTARRRMAAAGGSLVAAGVLAVGVGAGSGVWTSDVSTQAGPTQQQQREPTQHQAPRGGNHGGPTVLSLPGSGGGGCGSPDPELASALNRQLPTVSAASTPVSATSCPSDSRSASFQLTQGESTGKVTAIVSPVSSVTPELRDPGTSQRPDGTVEVTSRTDSGRVLIVRSKPAPDSPAPYSGRLAAMADTLSDQF